MAKEVVKVSPETREAYEAPKCEVMELQMEGVLCVSGWDPDPGHGGWEPNEPASVNWKESNRE